MDIFERAARKKFRFPSIKGDLTVEQLWDLPLVAGSGITRDVKFDLETVGRGILTELKGVTEDSLVNVNPDPRKGELEAKLDIIKHIIAVKQKEAADAQAAAARAEKRRKLVDAIASKEDEALSKASKEELLKQLEEMDKAAA
ncbi:conserved hypothetical protein [Mesorhizobium plurifarium]|uniref:Uncharacterized protein n=1 Tax=Mesorhizobium plurifarium TaxID=69974 RepID=A0A090EF62_MESPL|nr:conserved hypothetical protein [Mesorhizobium plurifarium]